MLLHFGLLLLGGVMLYFGAEWLVKGAAGLANVLGVPPLLIGLTVVSYGTSAPELAVSLIAASNGSSDICLGNVVGSNIANIGLILGITALIAPPRVDGGIGRREVLFLVGATLVTPLILMGSEITRIEGLLFLIGSVVFTGLTIRWSRKAKPADVEADDEVPDEIPATTSKVALSLWLALGLAVLLGGGKVFVTGAVEVARAFGMSERLVGLTVVAFGTSLPELAASLVAALRGHSELAVGNVVGSNVFNLLLILGATSVTLPIPADAWAMRLDLGVMIGLTLMCAFSMRKARNITRAEGVMYLTSYFGFIVVLALSA